MCVRVELIRGASTGLLNAIKRNQAPPRPPAPSPRLFRPCSSFAPPPPAPSSEGPLCGRYAGSSYTSTTGAPPRPGARAAIPRVPFAPAFQATDTSVAVAAARTTRHAVLLVLHRFGDAGDVPPQRALETDNPLQLNALLNDTHLSIRTVCGTME